MLLQGAGGFHGQGQGHPATEIVAGVRLQLLGRQRGDQGPDRFMVFARGFTFKHRGNGNALASGGEGLAIGLQGAGVNSAGADLLFLGQFAQVLHAWVAQGGQCGLGLIAGHGQFSRQGVGENLRARLELLDRDLLQDLRGLAGIALAIGQVGSAQAQKGGIFRRFALGGLLKQLLDTGVRCPW
ncbi:hypothetical protein D3C73_1221260 [compost metagenome]